MKNLLMSGKFRGEEFANAIQSWTMIFLTLAFIALYAAALFGGFKHLTDDRLIAHLEPIIFVVIGYFFGRLPARQNEQLLKEEIHRQIQRTDTAQQVKEQMQQARERLEEKINNVRTTLAPPAITASSAQGKCLTNSLKPPGGTTSDEALRRAVAAALKILDS
jgi:hypothetical protein